MKVGGAIPLGISMLGDGFHRWRCWRTQAADISDWRLAEQAAVFTVELTGAFVSHLKCDSGRVDIVGEHAGSRGLQPNLLLVLKRTHRCQRAEVMVKRRDSHAGNVGKLLHVKRLVVVRLDPGDCFGGAMTRSPSVAIARSRAPAGPRRIRYMISRSMNRSRTGCLRASRGGRAGGTTRLGTPP